MRGKERMPNVGGRWPASSTAAISIALTHSVAFVSHRHWHREILSHLESRVDRDNDVSQSKLSFFGQERQNKVHLYYSYITSTSTTTTAAQCCCCCKIGVTFTTAAAVVWSPSAQWKWKKKRVKVLLFYMLLIFAPFSPFSLSHSVSLTESKWH